MTSLRLTAGERPQTSDTDFQSPALVVSPVSSSARIPASHPDLAFISSILFLSTQHNTPAAESTPNLRDKKHIFLWSHPL
ncbi:hypothetical protein MHYP_G00279590 [Metynnis hypsauchen]